LIEAIVLPLSQTANQDGAVRHNSLSSFGANIRKLMYSLWRLLNVSDNALVRTALCSDLFAISPVLEGGVILFFSLLFGILYYLFHMYNYCFMGYEPATELNE